MTVVLDSGIWISGLQFGGMPLTALDQAFIYDQIAVCDDITSEVSTILVSQVRVERKGRSFGSPRVSD